MGKIFGGGQKVSTPAVAPVVAAPKPAPVVDETEVMRKKKQAAAAQQNRGGRQSTILSGESDTLG